MSEPTIQANIIANVNSDNLDDMKNLLSVLDQIGNNNTALPLGEPTQDISTDIPGTGSENLPVDELSDLTPEQDNALDDINNSMNLDESCKLNESRLPYNKINKIIEWYDDAYQVSDLVENMFSEWLSGGTNAEQYIQTQLDNIPDRDVYDESRELNEGSIDPRISEIIAWYVNDGDINELVFDMFSVWFKDPNGTKVESFIQTRYNKIHNLDDASGKKVTENREVDKYADEDEELYNTMFDKIQDHYEKGGSDLVAEMRSYWESGDSFREFVQDLYNLLSLDENINDPELCEFPGTDAINTAGVIRVAKDRPSIRDEDADTIYNESVEQFRASFNTFLESYGLNEAKSVEVKNKISNNSTAKCTLDKSKVKSLLNQRSLPKDVKDTIMTKVEKKIEKDDGIDWDAIRKIMKNSGASQEAIDKAESKCKNK